MEDKKFSLEDALNITEEQKKVLDSLFNMDYLKSKRVTKVEVPEFSNIGSKIYFEAELGRKMSNQELGEYLISNIHYDREVSTTHGILYCDNAVLVDINLVLGSFEIKIKPYKKESIFSKFL